MTDKDYEEMNLQELAAEMVIIKQNLEEAKAVASSFQKQFDLLRLGVIPSKMTDEGVKSATFNGIGRLGLTADMRVSTLAPNRMALQDWLKSHDHGDIITATVNAGTLKSWVKHQIDEGEEYPTELINVSPFMRASVTKA